MSKYKIVIKNPVTQAVVTEYSFEEKTSGEAKALAYVYGQQECSKLPDGEYTCKLLVKQLIFGGYKPDRNMPLFGYKVSHLNAKLVTDKKFFGGEADTLAVFKKHILTQAKFAANALLGDIDDIHQLFTDYSTEIVEAIDKLYKTYHPQYLHDAQYKALKQAIESEIKEEQLGYDAYKNDRSSGLYQSITRKCYQSIVTSLTQYFNGLIASV